MRPVWLSLIAAAVLWAVMFGLGLGNFWLLMSFSAGGLALFAAWIQRGMLGSLLTFRWSHVAVGVASAAVLYLIFFVGDFLSAMLFDFASRQVDGIYGMKAGTSPLVIGVLLVVLIGPAEEVFWRGFIQERFMRRHGELAGWFLGAAVYAGVHLWAWNFMLFMAAAVCGLFWGLVYLRWRSLVPVIISHALWDLAIFILFPVR